MGPKVTPGMTEAELAGAVAALSALGKGFPPGGPVTTTGQEAAETALARLSSGAPLLKRRPPLPEALAAELVQAVDLAAALLPDNAGTAWDDRIPKLASRLRQEFGQTYGRSAYGEVAQRDS